MLWRFCLYGFLKNQRYHEPFFVLALVEQGLNFLDIGLLVGFRELCVNLLEIPSGAVADLYGRRRSMVASFAAYIASFVLLAAAPGLGLLFLAMALFAVGEAFRTGTHKAMIFEWLRAEGREREKAAVYGYTRAWSKRGGALGALIAAAIAWRAGSLSTVFWFTTIPYAINLLNLATYPKCLEGHVSKVQAQARPIEVLRLSLRGIGAALRLGGLRRLLGESMAFEGPHKLARDYLQPLIELWVLSLPLAAWAADLGSAGDPARGAFRGTVITLSLVYFGLSLIESAASRRADALATRLGGDAPAIAWLWRANLAGYVLLLLALLVGWEGLAIVAFVLQTGALQNLFRPLQLARYDEHTPPALQATILSVESQSKALLVALAAPLVGWLIDRRSADGLASAELWPVAALGLAFALAHALRRGPRGAGSA